MDVVTLALAKKYTADTANSLGAVKGASATIKSITAVAGGNNVVFAWTGTDGTEQTQTMFVANGLPTASAESALPEASEALRGGFVIVPNGNTDKLYICMKIAGVYGWVEFNTNGNSDTSGATTSVLGQAVLGNMILGG